MSQRTEGGRFYIWIWFWFGHNNSV